TKSTSARELRSMRISKFIQKNKYRSMNFDISVDKNLIRRFIIPTKDGSTRGDVIREINNHRISSVEAMTEEGLILSET
ncbi:hypothetical protein L9F63_024439, partial [Diploptera punctata]